MKIVTFYSNSFSFFHLFTSLFSGYTMDVIASTGFGINIDSQKHPDSPLVKNARKVMEADFFKSLAAVASK